MPHCQRGPIEIIQTPIAQILISGMGKKMIDKTVKRLGTLPGQPLYDRGLELLQEFRFAVCTLPGHINPQLFRIAQKVLIPNGPAFHQHSCFIRVYLNPACYSAIAMLIQ
jgi:hypothetical protein